MKQITVRVPISLVLDPELDTSAKVVWMSVRLRKPVGPVDMGVLQAQSGLSRPTIRKGLAHLAAAGWYVPASSGPARALDRDPKGAAVQFPGDLLAERRVGMEAKLLYAALQSLAANQFSYATLGVLTHASLKTVQRGVRELIDSGWLKVSQVNQAAPITFSLHNPVAVEAEAEVIRANQRLVEAEFKGQELMREYLSLLVASDEFQDDASPGFLENPSTDHRLQYDRFYLCGVAFEFNGPQHHGPTERFNKTAAVRQQQVRDLMKEALSTRNNITLLVVHAEDLSLRVMKRIIGNHLPLRDLAGREPLVAYLETRARQHRLKAKRHTAPEPRQQQAT